MNSVRALEKRACNILNPHASRGVGRSTARDVDLDPVTMFRTSSVTVRGVDRPLSLHLDGELRHPDNRTVCVELLPQRLAILCVA